MINSKLRSITVLVVALISFILYAYQATDQKWLISPPEHGFVSLMPASKWEESMITGNGTTGALIWGKPQNEIIILSHERLFLPEYPPTEAPNLGKHLETIRELVLKGEGRKAAELAVQLGVEAGIEDLIWTDPLVPACQIEIESLSRDSIVNYARSVNYETGEALTTWKTEEGIFHRKIFTSRPDDISVLKIFSPHNIKQNVKIRLAQLPVSESETNGDLEDEFSSIEPIEEVKSTVNDDGTLTYITLFQKKWEGSLKGYIVEAKVIAKNGEMSSNDGWLFVNDTDEILVLSKIKLSYDLPVNTETNIDKYAASSYEALLEKHASIHGEMFNRFSFKLGSNEEKHVTSEDLLNSSSFGKLNNDLLVQIMEAARYTLISSTGELPPTLQGIWGGTWRPAWSGDFTHNGNVPSAIASGYNTNFIEVMDAYTNYMYSMFDDFKDNARDVYGFDGIFCLSRSSSSGKTYHYLDDYPHMYWFAGSAWFSQFFYDYWQYTGDEEFLKTKTIPFMKEALVFYKDVLVKDDAGRYMFVPSYSPEVGPIGHHPVVINATMDVAALRMLLNNLIKLADDGWVDTSYKIECIEILNDLPPYEIDENGELKEWIYPGLKNNNSHRHASHLLPLFYEVDPEFEKNPELKQAAVQAIENRMKYRRERNGAEMAFGLVQKGLAAAHINDTKRAYECVDWLCNSYWSPSFTSYHDPGEIFNVDICGGLPAVVTEMIIQSSADEVELLPALPDQWPEGEIKGVLTRSGVTVDFIWKDGKPLNATFTASRDTKFKLNYENNVWFIELKKGQIKEWEMN
jgi:hypothetical protein